MKFIHTADLHLESKIELLPIEKSRTRRDEILRTFEKLADYANDNDVRAIIIAGDMFDTNKISIKTKQRVLTTIKKYSHIDFLCVSGNHDKINFIMNEERLPKNLIIFGDKWSTINYDDCAITGISIDSVNQTTIYDNLHLDENKINIVIMHGQIVGYRTKENAEIISIPRLKEKNIDYLALGHIHFYDKGEIDNRGVYVYSGCLEGRGFDELGEKGFVLINCEKDRLESTFIPFSMRNLYEFEYDVQNYVSFFELADYIVNNLKEKVGEQSLIKVILKGQHKLDFYIDKFFLEKRLNEYFFFAKVYDKTELEISLNDYAYDKTVKGEFVRAVWESDLSMQEKNDIILCGLSALKGEEV